MATAIDGSDYSASVYDWTPTSASTSPSSTSSSTIAPDYLLRQRGHQSIGGFKVGDRVVAISPPDGRKTLVGKHGTILVLYPQDTRLPVIVGFEGVENYEYDTFNWSCEVDSLAPEKDERENIL